MEYVNGAGAKSKISLCNVGECASKHICKNGPIWGQAKLYLC
jgi:hypothetical protein